jgi:hypothetical protein
MNTVGIMCILRSPISVGWAESPNAELTMSAVGRMFLSYPLSPVPLMNAPVSITVTEDSFAREWNV